MEEMRSYVSSETSSLEDEPNKLVMWRGGNGDYYMSICPASHRAGITIRFETSGGCATRNLDLLKAIGSVFRALEEAEK